MCRHVITRPNPLCHFWHVYPNRMAVRETPSGQVHTTQTSILGTPQKCMTKLGQALCRERDGRPVQRREVLPAGKGHLSVSSSARCQSSRVRSWSSLSRTGKSTMGNATRWPLTQRPNQEQSDAETGMAECPHYSRKSPFGLCRVPQFLGSSCSPATVPLQLAYQCCPNRCSTATCRWGLFVFPPYQMADLHVISL